MIIQNEVQILIQKKYIYFYLKTTTTTSKRRKNIISTVDKLKLLQLPSLQQAISKVRQETKGCSYKIPATIKDSVAVTKQQLAISEEIDSKLLPIFPAFNSSTTEISFQRMTEEQR